MNKKALGLAGLGAVALVGGSLAYYNHTATLDNPFTTGQNSTELHEDYTPPIDDMKPGAKWDKKVGATNTGDYPVLVRIKMDEKWTRKGENEAYKALSSTAGTNKEFFLASTWNEQDKVGYDEESGKFYAKQMNESDGQTPGGHLVNEINGGDETVVHKNLLADSDQTAPNWFYHDGYWYWNRVLEPKKETSPLMDYLVLANNIDLGKYIKTEYYQIQNIKDVGETTPVEGAWLPVEKHDKTESAPASYTVYKDAAKKESVIVVDKKEENTPEGALVGNEDGQLDIIDIAKALDVKAEKQKIFWQSESALGDANFGYANSNYTLSINASFVQATTDAVKEEWGIANPDAFFGKEGTLVKIKVKEGDTTLVNVDVSEGGSTDEGTGN